MIQQELELFKNSVKIPEGAVLADKSDRGDQVDWYYLLSETETNTHVIKKFLHIRHFKSTGRTYSNKTTEKYQKFLCVGGPLDGQMMDERKADGYCSYNCARRHAPKGYPRVILVWLDH